jgi:flagellar hook-associated protein 1 FlgK
MSISGSLSSALSGLTVAARAAEVVSSNIANAMTEGYGRRELQTSSRSVGSSGQGVRVTGVLRQGDPVLLGDRRMAEAESGGSNATAAFLKRLERVLGTPDTATSLGSRIADFDTALIEASSRPESEARLSRVAETAKAVVRHLSTTSDDIQAARSAADDQIQSEVARINTALTRVAELNSQIRANAGSGRDASALVDQRQQVIDGIASIVPLREVPRGHGQVALFSSGGAILLDGAPTELGFTPVGIIVPGMTQGSGALSGLTINGKAVTAGQGGAMSGGSLSGHFAVRDELGPQAQARLDALARDLTERFAGSTLDTTRAPGAAGLFTDAGSAFLPAGEIGLSQRLRLNAAADPVQGGDLWRLRDGLGATAPGAAGDSRLLKGMQAALVDQRSPVSGGFMAGNRSLSTLAADMLSGVASARLTAEGEASYASARMDTLRQMELEGGVDTDQEMQSLLLIEQAYAANAKVVSAVGDMIQRLLEM